MAATLQTDITDNRKVHILWHLHRLETTFISFEFLGIPVFTGVIRLLGHFH